MKTAAIATVAALSLASLAAAQDTGAPAETPMHGDMQQDAASEDRMDMGGMPGMGDHMALMQKHMAEMQALMDGMHGMDMGGVDAGASPDVAFARGMIVHHEGAVEMAETLLENGSDPEMQELARNVIATQREEIDFMEDWLARNGG